MKTIQLTMLVVVSLALITVADAGPVKRGCNLKTCQNNGHLDIGACKCKCVGPFIGERCEIKRCPFREPAECAQIQNNPDNCNNYWTVPILCPYSCGLCIEAERPPCDFNNNTHCHVSTHGCVYMGQQAGLEYCQKFSMRHSRGSFADVPACMNTGKPGYVCADCGFDNVLKMQCPFMCGLCQSRCGEFFCKNGGILDPNTCECECQANYIGEDCSEKICPDHDPPACSQYTPQSGYCDNFYDSRFICPYLCGECAYDPETRLEW